VHAVELGSLHFYQVNLVVSKKIVCRDDPFTDHHFPRFCSDHFKQIDTTYTYAGIHLRAHSPLNLSCSLKDYSIAVAKGHHCFPTRHQLYDESEGMPSFH